MKVTSFVIVDKQTGKAVMETFNRATADAVNRNKFDVLPTLEYLQKLNRDLSMERKSNPTKKFSPAQIAAQRLFAERARAGTLGKTVKRKAAVKRNPVTPSSDYDYALITEVKLVAVNDGNLYRQQGRPIVENLAKKVAKGTFDSEKAVKLFGYLADSAVRKYSTEQMGFKKPTLTILSKPEREILAQHLLEAYADEIQDTAGGYKRNPDKAKPRAYVKRASQATGAPPSKRLVTRRKKALTAPAGYFPNPKVKYTNRAKDMQGDQRVGYAVHMADRPSYQAIAWFSKKDDAVKVAQEASDRTGKQLAVTRVQNYFGAM
jgi:hypothetical protein